MSGESFNIFGGDSGPSFAEQVAKKDPEVKTPSRADVIAQILNEQLDVLKKRGKTGSTTVNPSGDQAPTASNTLLGL